MLCNNSNHTVTNSGICPECIFTFKPKTSRAGFRYFQCSECEHVWEQPTRDCLSPSVETCPECSADNQPIGFKQDEFVRIDKFGNLI